MQSHIGKARRKQKTLNTLRLIATYQAIAGSLFGGKARCCRTMRTEAAFDQLEFPLIPFDLFYRLANSCYNGHPAIRVSTKLINSPMNAQITTTKRIPVAD